ncbi:MAG: 7-cyano-7-deazaguanine synthase QueC [Candidatus Omnitrophica bacterium]|nr:7-cyano-7-deazaguanine synthase QueC [Candidatus Omnitrophota bacterium]
MAKKAVVLLSGGLDSAVTLFYAINKGYECFALTFDYGQRHLKEIAGAKRIAALAKAHFEAVSLKFPWKGSSLTDKQMILPVKRTIREIRSGIPSTYVPARNSIFLSIAASYAEAIGASKVFIGAHSEDSSGYPDCRKGYLEKFAEAMRLGTKAGTEGRLLVEFPRIDKTKSGIIKLGGLLGVPFEFTGSCYRGGVKPCGECDSCILRAKGFKEAGIKDPHFGLNI